MTLRDVPTTELVRVVEAFDRVKTDRPDSDEDTSTATFYLRSVGVANARGALAWLLINWRGPDYGGLQVTVAEVRAELVRRADA